MKGSLFAELERRNVFRAGAFYIAAVWAFGQGLSQFSPAIGLPDWATRWFLVAAVIGFPLWIAFAWFYEWTPEGFKREREVEPGESITPHTGRKLDFAIIGVLSIAVVLLLTDRFVLRHGVNAQEEVAISEKSIAVLPFVNMSSDKEQEYFSDGISEELLNLLAKIPALHVAARTSSFSFKGKEVGIPEIAKALLVANVLEGSVRKSGDQLRITAQLIRASDGYHIWSETFDRKLDDIFKTQDEISAKVVEQLKVTLLGAVPKARETDPNAYAMYLQARQLGFQVKADAYKQSDALYRQVLAIDPRYAPAWSGLARNAFNERITGVVSEQEGFARSREASLKALAIDPEYAPAHVQMGYVAMYADLDLAVAARHYERALALDPADLDVLTGAAGFLQNIGRIDEALPIRELVVRRDPVNLNARYNLGLVQIFLGRYDAAIDSLRTVLSLSPDRPVVHRALGLALMLKGDAADALAEIEQETDEDWRMIALPAVYCALERKVEADQAFAALIAKDEKDSPGNIAEDYAFCGNADKAFEWLDKAIEYRDAAIAEIPANKMFDKIHPDPRWLPFLRKIGRDPDTLAKIEFNVTLPKEWQADAEAAAKAASNVQDRSR